jgi:hypothetical protein
MTFSGERRTGFRASRLTALQRLLTIFSDSQPEDSDETRLLAHLWVVIASRRLGE